VYSGQAWHWISREVRYVAARAALVDGGALAVFWNVPDWSVCDLRDELGEVYRRHGHAAGSDDPLNPAGHPGEEDWIAEIAGASGFSEAEVRRYRWHADYATAEYLDLLGTHSACLILDPPQRDGLLSDIGDVIDARGGTFRMHYVTRLCLARAT
jgi:hypothetical protein